MKPDVWLQADAIINDVYPGWNHIPNHGILRERIARVVQEKDADYQRIITEVLLCDPIPARSRDDNRLEPPWEVIKRIRNLNAYYVEKFAERDAEIEGYKNGQIQMQSIAAGLYESCQKFGEERERLLAEIQSFQAYIDKLLTGKFKLQQELKEKDAEIERLRLRLKEHGDIQNSQSATRD